MRGFQPAAGRAPVQKFADGGFVQSLKERMFGKPETITEKYARQDAELMARMGKQQPAPAPAPAAPGNAIGDYVGMTALQRREKDAGLKHGGMVRGPGTGTSDSIAARLSDGEYVLPADTVQAIGVPALDAVKDATHAPAGKAARGFKPELFFAHGGLVEDKLPGMSAAERPMSAAEARLFGVEPTTGAAPKAAAPTATAAAAPAMPGVEVSERPMTRAEARGFAPRATNGLGARVSGAMQGMSQGLTDVTGLGGTLGQGFMGKTARALGRVGSGALKLAGRVALPLAAGAEGLDVAKVALDPKASGIDVATQVAQGAGRLGAATAGAGAGAAVGALGGPLAPVTVPLGALAGGALGFLGAHRAIEAGRAAVGVDAQAPADRAPSLMAAADAATMPAVAAPAANPTDQRLANGAPAATTAATPADTAVTLGGQTGAFVAGAPGVSKFKTADGRTLYSNVAGPDNDQLMSGRPGVQVAPGMAGAGSGEGAAAGASGFNPALSAARAAAAARGDFDAVRDSYFAQGQSFNGQTRESVEADRLKALALSPRGTPGRLAALEMLRDQTAAATADKARAGADRLAQQEFGLKQTAAGFQTRASQALEDAQKAYSAATTAAERETARETLRSLQGKYEKDLPNKFTVVPGGSEIDPASGMTVNRPATVLNNQTGEFVTPSQQTPPRAPHPEGTKLKGKDGKIYVVKNGKPVLE